MARRCEQRLRTVLPVRIFGTDSSGKPFTDLAHTLDISGLGARLGGVQHVLDTGDIVGVQRGVHKARFRVAWVGERGTRSSGQIGVVCMEPAKNIWSVDFAEHRTADAYDPKPTRSDNEPVNETTKPRRDERRLTRRIPCSIGVEMRVEGTDVPLYARCTDLSTGGCYIDTRAPLPRDTRLRIVLRPDSPAIIAGAIVRTSDDSFGMGVQFVDLTTENATRLGALLAKVAGKQSAVAAAPGAANDFEMKEQLLRVTKELRELETRMSSCRIDPASLSDFRMALDKARHSTWAIKQLAHSGSEAADAAQVAQAMTEERMRIATAVARELCADLSSRAPTNAELLSNLFQAVGCLFQRAGHALAKCKDRGVQSPQQPAPSEVLRFARPLSQRPS